MFFFALTHTLTNVYVLEALSKHWAAVVSSKNYSKVNIHRYIRGDGFKLIVVIICAIKVVASSKTGVAEQVGWAEWKETSRRRLFYTFTTALEKRYFNIFLKSMFVILWHWIISVPFIFFHTFYVNSTSKISESCWNSLNCVFCLTFSRWLSVPQSVLCYREFTIVM